MVRALTKSGATILQDLTPDDANLWHMATGLSGESGELLDAVKKRVVYRKELDRQNVIEELGDLEFYLEGIREAVGVTRDECLEANQRKLAVRYRDLQYSDQAAHLRADKTTQ